DRRSRLRAIGPAVLRAARDGRKDRHDVAVRDSGFQRAQVAHVFIVHVDVDEAMQSGAVGEDVLRDARIPRLEILQDLAERRTFGGHPRLVTGELAKDRGELDGNGHRFSNSSYGSGGDTAELLVI